MLTFKDLNMYSNTILNVLIDYYKEYDGLVFPSIQTIADKVLCHRRTVERHMKTLVELGYVKIVKRYRKTNEYILDVDKCGLSTDVKKDDENNDDPKSHNRPDEESHYKSKDDQIINNNVQSHLISSKYNKQISKGVIWRLGNLKKYSINIIRYALGHLQMKMINGYRVHSISGILATIIQQAQEYYDLYRFNFKVDEYWKDVFDRFHSVKTFE